MWCARLEGTERSAAPFCPRSADQRDGRARTLCEHLADEPFICVDTEFLSGQTFWPKLCLVQLAGSDGEGHAVDALTELDLEPLYRLLNEASPIKVFHACRQDVGIFFLATGRVPTPLFDTQVAAMACAMEKRPATQTLPRPSRV